MEKTIEFVRANLPAIVEQLKSCGFVCEGGKLENNAAFVELERIADSRFNVAACLANYFEDMTSNGLGITINEHDLGRPIFEDQEIRITVEYIPKGEKISW